MGVLAQYQDGRLNGKRPPTLSQAPLQKCHPRQQDHTCASAVQDDDKPKTSFLFSAQCGNRSSYKHVNSRLDADHASVVLPLLSSLHIPTQSTHTDSYPAVRPSPRLPSPRLVHAISCSRCSVPFSVRPHVVSEPRRLFRHQSLVCADIVLPYKLTRCRVRKKWCSFHRMMSRACLMLDDYCWAKQENPQRGKEGNLDGWAGRVGMCCIDWFESIQA